MRIRPAGCWFLFGMLCSVASGADTISFNRQIRPLLSDRCFQCHGPSDADREADLRLDRADGDAGPFLERDGYTVIKPHDVRASVLWQRLVTDDAAEHMPPPDSNKQPLSDAEKALIKQWIEEGATYESFWAFVPPRSVSPPAVTDSQWLAQRVDQFVLARLERENHSPQPRADKRTLIRRVTFDLTGVPPTRAEIHRFLEDASPSAYEELVDRLMASPRYGEHMAKYWLDLVRFADTNGIHHDHYRESTPYRDWVIRAFNRNLSFDDFITYQLAGDLYAQPTLDQQIASGFNRLHLVIDRGTALPQESYTRNVVDRVSGFGTAFLGLTLGCAVCHDHKYDPVTQRDFYQLFAFFNNIDTAPETPGKNPHAPFIRVPNTVEEEQLAQFDAQLATLRAALEKAQESTHAEDRKSKERELQALVKSRANFEQQLPITLVSRERNEMRPAYVLTRGAYDQPGAQVERGTPAFLPPLVAEGAVKTRMDLARWLTHAEHPLTARVTTNRIWQQFFGVGLVKTSEDFGAQGEYPSHPALLDDLANRFVQSGWNVKRFVRALVLSQTYQQSSHASPSDYKADADNRLLARGARFRLDSEMIRDQILFTSGLLNESMFGKSVKPPQPPNLWKSVSMVSSSTYSFQADQGAKIYRRSIYSFWKRAMPPPQMTIFDAPTRESCIARRERTNTPVQALVLMNETQYFHAARSFAQRLLGHAEMADKERLRVAYESITSHLPDQDELASLSRALRELRELYRADKAAARELTADMAPSSDTARVELAAHTMLVNALFNLDVVKTRD